MTRGVLDPAAPAGEWGRVLLEACRDAAPGGASAIVAARLSVPSGQAPRRVARLVDALRQAAGGGREAAERARAWEALAGVPFIPLGGPAPERYLVVRVEPCPERPPHGAVDYHLAPWPARPPDPVRGVLGLGRPGIAAPELRGMMRTVPGEEGLFVGAEPLRLPLGAGPGAVLRTSALEGELAWDPPRGWHLDARPGPGVELSARPGGVAVYERGRLLLRTSTFRDGVSLGRAATVAGRIPGVTVAAVGRALPEPVEGGGWGVAVHEHQGAVLPPWVRSSLRLGTVWLAAGGERTAWVGAGGGAERPAAEGKGIVLASGPELVATFAGLPEEYRCAARFRGSPARMFATAHFPFDSRLLGTGPAAGLLADPYASASGYLRIEPAKVAGRVRIEVAEDARCVPVLWIREGAPGGAWVRPEGGGVRTFSLPAALSYGTLLLELSSPSLDFAE